MISQGVTPVANGTEKKPPLNWAYLGSSSSKSSKISYPENAHEFMLVMKSNQGGAAYVTTIQKSVIDDLTIDNIQVGGYYSASGDYGFALVTIDRPNRTMNFREMRYGSTTTGTLHLYYR